MDKILLGLIFIFFNLNLSFSFIITINIDFLPDFVGYLLLYLGIKTFKNNSKHFKDIIPSTIILIVLSISIFIINFLMFNINEIIFFSLDIIMMLILIYILYKIIKGINVLEKIEERDYGTKLLYNTWKIFSIVVFIVSLTIFISDIYEKVLLIATIIVILMMIIFLIVFNRTRMLYNSYR